MTRLVCLSCREPWQKPGKPERDDLTCSCGGRRVFPGQAKPRAPISRVSEKRQAADRAKGRKRYSTTRQSQPRRIWDRARAKIDADPTCRFCGREDLPERLQACHVSGRDRDGFDPVTREPRPQPWVVEPDRIVQGHAECHRAYDAHEGDGLLGKLTLEEEVQAVRDHYPVMGRGRGSGISLSLRRLDPSVEGRLAA